jgi:RNA-directed DNA polymerase
MKTIFIALYNPHRLVKIRPERAGFSSKQSKYLEANKKGYSMKRHGYIFDKVCEIKNIKQAIMKSSLGKRKQKRVKHVLDHIDTYALKIQKMLVDKTYIASDYIIKIIQDGANKKERTICKPRFYPDQIIHWALMLQLQPIIMKGMYEYNCGSVPHRGTSFGQKTLRKWLDTDIRNTKYCLKMDISKFYPSVDNQLLKLMFRKKIKDSDCLWLIDTIIESAEGLPIGNYTSQWFSNFFLQELDHLIKERLGVKYYVRYVDDLVLLGPNKKKLHKVRVAVEQYLNSINLNLKDNWQVFKVNSRDIDFLGFRFYRNKTTLRKRNALRIKRRINKISRKGYLNEKDSFAIISYWGWIKRSDSFSFYNKYVKPFVGIKLAKKVVSVNAKIRLNGGRPIVIKLGAT